MSSPSDDMLHLPLREGMHIVLSLLGPQAPWVPLGTAWSCSALLEGKPVVMTEWLPGVCLHIATRLKPNPALPGFFQAAWPRAQELALAWKQRTSATKAFAPYALPLAYSEAWLAHDLACLPPAALRLDWRPPQP